MLARFTQGGGEAFVLGDGLLELALGLEDLLLERAHALGCVLEAAAEDADLFLQPLELALEVADLAFVLSQTPVVLGSHAVTSWIGPGCDVPGVGHYTGPFRGRATIHAVHVAVIPAQHSGVTVSGSRIFPGFGLRNPQRGIRLVVVVLLAAGAATRPKGLDAR